MYIVTYVSYYLGKIESRGLSVKSALTSDGKGGNDNSDKNVKLFSLRFRYSSTSNPAKSTLFSVNSSLPASDKDLKFGVP